MSPQGTTEQLSTEQIDAIFRTTSLNNTVAFIPSGGTGFPQLLPTNLAGDYNGDYIVNAADYIVWRNSLGSRSNLAADGNGNQVIDVGDFTVWKANFGSTLGSGGGSSAAIPEPGTLVFALAALSIWLSTGRPAHRPCRPSAAMLWAVQKGCGHATTSAPVPNFGHSIQQRWTWLREITMCRCLQGQTAWSRPSRKTLRVGQVLIWWRTWIAPPGKKRWPPARAVYFSRSRQRLWRRRREWQRPVGAIGVR